jgi:NADPH-dependent curcumin reductase CurA
MTRNARAIFNERPAKFPEPGKTIVYDESETIDIDNIPLNGGILVKVLLLSIDPYMRGRMNEGPSYTAGFTIGEPISGYGVAKVLRSENSKFATGSYVYGILPHVEYWVATSPESLRVIDNKEQIPLSLYVGLAGMAGKTAWMAWKEYSHAKPGETVFISGGAGPVGSFVAQIAKKQGLKVIASAGTDTKVDFLRQIGVDVAFNYKTTDTREVLAKEGPINIYWDNVGGETLEAALDNAALNGRIIACGSISGYNGDRVGVRNLHKIYAQSLTMYGFIVHRLYGKYDEAFYEEVPKLLASGDIKYTEHITRGLENVGQAILDVQIGRNEGKSVVIVADD